MEGYEEDELLRNRMAQIRVTEVHGVKVYHCYCEYKTYRNALHSGIFWGRRSENNDEKLKRVDIVDSPDKNENGTEEEADS